MAPASAASGGSWSSESFFSLPPLLLSFSLAISTLLFRHLVAIEHRAIISLVRDIAIDRDRSRDTVTGRTDPPPPPPPPPLPTRGLSNKFTDVMDRPLEIPFDTGGTPLLALSALCPFESIPQTENASCSSRRYRLVPRSSSSSSDSSNSSSSSSSSSSSRKQRDALTLRAQYAKRRCSHFPHGGLISR